MAARSWGRTASATMSVSRSRSRSSTPFTATSPISVDTIPEMAVVTVSVSRSPSACSNPCRREASLRRAAAHPSSSASDVLSSLTRLPPSSISIARCWATLAERAWTWRRRPSNSSRIQTRTWGPVSRPCAARGCGSLIPRMVRQGLVIWPAAGRRQPVARRPLSADLGRGGLRPTDRGDSVARDGLRCLRSSGASRSSRFPRRWNRSTALAPPSACARARSGPSGTTSPGWQWGATRPASSSTCAPTPLPRAATPWSPAAAGRATTCA